MSDVRYDKLFCCKIAMIGACAVGKTAIINRLINNHFPVIYEPTMNVENYTFLFNLSDREIKQKNHVMVTLEDMFGLNNPLLQTPEQLITSNEQAIQRNEMTKIFRDIMFTSSEKRKQLSTESKKVSKSAVSKKKITKQNVYENIFNDAPTIERKGFILVCDPSDYNTLEDLSTILEKLHQIEKTNNLIYPKSVLINKIDKADKEKMKRATKFTEELRSKYKTDIFKISALTNYEVEDSFKRIVSKINQQEIDSKQSEGMDDQDEVDEEPETVKFDHFNIF
jgi:GTPase SAR1 family protein